MSDHQPTRCQLLRWAGWYAAANAGLFALVAQRYLWIYTFPNDAAGIVYALLTFVGHITLLAAVPLFLLLTPVILLTRSLAWSRAAGVAISALGLSLLLLDTIIFAEHRFHLGLLTASLFETSTWIFVGVLFVIFVVFHVMLAGIVWRFAVAERRRRGAVLVTLLLGSWLASQALHIWGDAVGHTPVTQFTRFMPLYFPVHAKRDLARLGLVDPEKVREQRMLRGSLEAADGQLQYPLEPLRCAAPGGELPNIVVILIDALRPDAIDPELMPALAAFRDEAIVFERQFSGGNSSRMGLFSLFYGLPSTYWQSFYDLQRGPVLMEQVRNRGYEAGLFSAAGFGSPALIDRTAFAGWPDLGDKRADLTPVERNRQVTDDWLDWLERRESGAPVFGFLYYDPPAGEIDHDPAERLPLEARYRDDPKARQLWLDYRLAVRFIDAEVGRVIDDLRARNLFAESLVIVVSDHGFEFDDNGAGYYGHASNFSPVQLRSTLMMSWPGRAPASIDYRTTHHDVPVTLLEELFGCTNPPRDYSIGRNLFAGQPWDWTMAGSYTSHAIVSPERVIVSLPGGFVEIMNNDWRPAADRSLDGQLIQDSLEAQRRFLK